MPPNLEYMRYRVRDKDVRTARYCRLESDPYVPRDHPRRVRLMLKPRRRPGAPDLRFAGHPRDRGGRRKSRFFAVGALWTDFIVLCGHYAHAGVLLRLAHDHHALYLHIPPHERSFASRREHRTGTLLQIHLRGSMEGGTGADVFTDDEAHLPPAAALAGRPQSCVQQPFCCSRLPRVDSVWRQRRDTPSHTPEPMAASMTVTAIPMRRALKNAKNATGSFCVNADVVG